MVNILNTGLSGLLAAQRSLATVGHNVANVNTAGFSRQRVELGTALPQLQGGSYIGSGVNTIAVRRVFDNFLIQQVRDHGSGHSQLETLDGLISQVNSIMGDQGTSLSAPLQEFFAAIQEVSANPGFRPARQEMLSSAEALAARLQSTHNQLNDLRQNVNQELQHTVTEINDLAENIAAINREIVTAGHANSPPNDLLDRRDKLLEDLGQRVNVQTVAQSDGTVTVFIGSGQALVTGTDTGRLTVMPSARDPQDLAIGYQSRENTAAVDISQRLAGGKIGGYLSFRRDVLEPTQNQLGLLAMGLAETFNAQHRSGMDLNGDLGEDFFQAGSPQVFSNADNGGSGLVTAAIDDVGLLTGSDYKLSYDGTNYNLKRLSDGTTVASGATGPFNVDGLTIDLASGAPAAGDSFLIQPTRAGASNFAVTTTNPDKIAAAVPIAASASTANQGKGDIFDGVVVDATHPDLRRDVEIRFTSSTTFDVIDTASGTALATGQTYTDGDEISFNGWSVTITGALEAGDSFTVTDNTGAVGDNRNALVLGELQFAKTLLGGSSDYQEVITGAVSAVGSQGSRVKAAYQVQDVLLNNATQARAALSGVNLEEAAADLMRFQQSFEASAQVIQTANTVFNTILSVAGR